MLLFGCPSTATTIPKKIPKVQPGKSTPENRCLDQNRVYVLMKQTFLTLTNFLYQKDV